MIPPKPSLLPTKISSLFVSLKPLPLLKVWSTAIVLKTTSGDGAVYVTASPFEKLFEALILSPPLSTSLP